MINFRYFSIQYLTVRKVSGFDKFNGLKAKAKAQSLLVSWLDAGSKNDLSDATFLGEPALMKLFTKYNTPIPSSAAVERLFSIGKEILRERRCQLSDNMYELLLFMKWNLHHMASKKWSFGLLFGF